MTLEEYTKLYQNNMTAAVRPPRLTQKDFILNGSQEIIYHNDTGNSFFFQ